MRRSVFRTFLLSIALQALCFLSLAQLPMAQLSVGTGILSSGSLSREFNVFGTTPHADRSDLLAFPLVHQADICIQLNESYFAAFRASSEKIAADLTDYMFTAGMRSMIPLRPSIRTYVEILAGVRLEASKTTSVKFGYSGTAIGLQYGRKLFVDASISIGRSGLFRLKLGLNINQKKNTISG